MSGDRLNDCMLLVHEKDITDQVDLKRIAKKWAMLKNRREKINENLETTLKLLCYKFFESMKFLALTFYFYFAKAAHLKDLNLILAT